MKIAGHTAAVCAQFDSTKEYFRAYLSQESPEFTIAPTQEDLAFEQAFSLAEAEAEGIRPRIYTQPHLERAAIRRGFAEFLLPRNVLELHGSTVAVDGQAYLFAAKCGTGKSTHTRLWREVFAGRAVMVNDDKPFLRIENGCVTAFGSPWSGKHGLDSNIAVPLAGICILERGAENKIRPISPAEAMPMLQLQAYMPLDEQNLPQRRHLLAQLADTVALWHMECNKAPDAAVVAHAAMARKSV